MLVISPDSGNSSDDRYIFVAFVSLVSCPFKIRYSFISEFP